jgi:hypothetical protein
MDKADAANFQFVGNTDIASLMGSPCVLGAKEEGIPQALKRGFF